MLVKVANLNSALLAILTIISCSYCSAYNLDTLFPIIYKGSIGSYFGYTTELHKNRWGYLALVGAPKANTTTFPEFVYESGTLFRCNITRKSPNLCEEVHLMQEGATEENRRYENAYKDKKDSMWLGVSLGVRPSRTKHEIVTCGHLWKNKYHRGLHLVNGVCYVINGDLEKDSVQKLLPSTRRSLQYGKGFDGLTEYGHALAQTGMSLAFSENGSLLILGSPGVWTWTGSIVIYGSTPDYSNDIFRNPVTPYPPHEVPFSSYFGYSVSTGKFFASNTEFFAAGAPKDGYNGKVYIVKQSGNNIRVHQKKQGAQMGEYFGACVLGVNLNGDTFTDLLVGAPLFSLDSGGDEGKVYVYISNGKDLQKYTELTGDKKENARFGTAIANIGDLNQDGYTDIAIGAPNEDKQGAVYIYHGSSSGVRTKYAQKIQASSLNPRLSGFGIHISHDMDIDDNGYPDILIGSYASSNAVLLRSRPIIRAFPELTFIPKRISINQTICDVDGKNLTCVRIDTCLRYTGRHVPSILEFRFSVLVKDSSWRGFFTRKRSQKTGLKMILDINKKICSQFQLYLHEDIDKKDVITPIAIQFSHELIPPKGSEKRFNETFPMYHPTTLRNITSEIPFQTGCGKDDECHSDLAVLATRIEPEEHKLIILGQYPTITIQIIVKNMKEPAYLSELLIDLPPELPSIKYEHCDVGNQQNNASLVCNLDNPLRNDTQITRYIKLDATNIPPHTKYLEIICRAVTLSIEMNPDDNVEVIPLHLETRADIGIIGAPSDNQMLYDGTKSSSPIISHTYTIRNYGPSPLENIDVLLKIPYMFITQDGSKQFLSFTALEKDSGSRFSIPAVCDDASLNLKDIESSHKNREKDNRELFIEDRENSSSVLLSKDQMGVPSDLTQNSDVQPELLQSDKENTRNKSTSSKTRGYTLINCDRKDIECFYLRCSAASFTKSRKFAQISLGFQLNYTILDDHLGSWYEIEFVTSGHISVNDSSVVQIYDHPNVFEVRTTVLHEGPPPPEELSAWVIFVSVGVGIALLLIILIILIKVGFFRRKEKDIMKEMLCDTKQGEQNPQPIDDSLSQPQPQ